MLSLGLYLAMCCHTVAPHLLKTGMTPRQVEAILGERSGTFIHTGPATAGWWKIYHARGVSVFYGEKGAEDITIRKR